MNEALPTFSESWHRVARQSIYLRPEVQAQRQRARGERWIVLCQPYSNRYFRLTPSAYDFVSRLRPGRTVEEVWKECLERFPDESPGQEEVIQLLAQLYHANLLHYGLANDSQELFRRYKERRQKDLRSRFLNLMFIRVPLFDPDGLLNRTVGLVGQVFSKLGFLVWLAVTIAGLKVVADHFPKLADQAQGVLAPSNLGWLYLAIILTKGLHEFGHAYACKRHGGEVHVMGLMLLVFTPAPYVDATSSWGFRSRWRRIAVAAAGVYVELFLAAIAALVWQRSSPGLLHNLCYNVMFAASVSTLLFNLNPLLRFDGYYIFSDLVGIPNLYDRSLQQLRHLSARYLLGAKQSASPARSQAEAYWLGLYGLSSIIYRFLIFAGIILFISTHYLLLGVIMALFCLVGWLIVPVVRLVNFLATSPTLARCRPRAVAVTALLLGGILALLQFLPFPSHFRAAGVVKAADRAEVRTPVNGAIVEIHLASGRKVMANQPLFRLENPDLALQRSGAQARLREVEARIQAATGREPPVLKPLEFQRESALKAVERLEKQMADLLVKAPRSGLWIAPDIEQQKMRWNPQGSPIGVVVDPDSVEIHAIVPQDEANRLFQGEVRSAEARLVGQASQLVRLRDLRIIPGERHELPSRALGWAGGGEIMTDMRDPEGRFSAEPFFEVRGRIADEDRPLVSAFHGRSGKIRFDVGSEPLLPRCVRRLRQLFQKRYQI